MSQISKDKFVEILKRRGGGLNGKGEEKKEVEAAAVKGSLVISLSSPLPLFSPSPSLNMLLRLSACR